MRIRNTSFRCAFALAAALAMLAPLPGSVASAQGRTSAPVLDKGVDYSFRTPIYNGFGASSLRELRGKPLLVEYWSYRCTPCVGSAVPHALRMKERFGDDVNVLFCEAGNTGENQVLSYALNKGWLASGAMWTNEQPVRRNVREVPYFILFDAEGEVVLEGLASERDPKLEEEVEGLVRQTARGPRELPRSLAKAIAEATEGNFTRARDMAQAEIDEAGEDALKEQEARRVLATVKERLEQSISRATWMLDNGYPIDASDALDKLAKGVKGWEEPAKQIEELRSKLDTPEMKREAEAQKALQKVERKLFADPDIRLVKQLQKIVERYPRTKTAERAKKLAKIASI